MKHLIFVAVAGLLLAPRPAAAFWLLGFSTGDTLPQGDFSAIAGTGGQYSSVGDPKRTSFTPFLPHAGFRAGIADGWDIGYRLTQVALPFSGVGPSLGGEIDLKRRLTPADSAWQAAIVIGMAYSYLDISDQSRNAWSPGADLIISRTLNERYAIFTDLRYVYTAIPSALGGSGANYVNAAGAGLGVRIKLTKMMALVPEAGVFDFTGRLANRTENGIGVQYGAVLLFRF
ncbi:MAG TPA: hypothetical protein VHO91_06095 [Rhodopila sp.]|nr:hypothetical protein [Rhodopila sp.]